MVITQPSSPKHLAFEAQRFLASRLDRQYDLYAYFEDDLIILDPWFFRKIDWFRSQAGDDCILFPHRIELASEPHPVDRFFIDGPMPESDLRQILPEPEPPICAQWPGGNLFFELKQPPCRLFYLEWVAVASLDSAAPLAGRDCWGVTFRKCSDSWYC